MTKLTEDIKRNSSAGFGFSEVAAGAMLFQMLVSTGIGISQTITKITKTAKVPPKKEQKPPETINYSRLNFSSQTIIH